MASDISVTINPPAQIGVTIADGVPKHSATHAPEGSDSLSAYYVTGSVVRPSETGNFILASQTGQFVGTGQTGFYTGVFYPYSSNPNGYVQGAVVRPSNTGGFLDTGSSQTVNSLKNFLVRPTVSGTGVLLSGEAVTNSQTGQFVGTGQTGSFITSSQTGTFVGTDQTGFYTGVFYPYSSNPNGYVQGSVVRPSNTGAFLDTGSSQTINSLKNFLVRPTVNGTGVLLSGETPNSVDTGVLTGVFYPLNSNPNGYITGVDLSNYVTKSSTGIFVTTGQTGNFITTSQTGGFVSTGSTGSFITSSQTGQFVSTGSTGSFVTGSVVRPSETGNFVTTSQTGQFVSTGATGNFVTGSVVRPNETGSFVTGSVVRPSETGNFITASQTGQFVGTGATGGFAVNTQVVFITGNQDVSGIKNFYSRPTVNGTGVLLSGEATALPTTILYTTGNQIKSGRLIIGDTIVDSSHPYTLSLQSNNQDTFLEILNSGGVGEGVFFGINNNDFEQYNWQGGDIVFFTAETSEAGYARLIIKNDGKVGIGTNSPSEKLDVSGDIKANSATFNTRPTINGTGVLLSGEAVSAANTGSLTGVFYPLNANPSGYITGSVVRPSETGVFVTTGSTGNFVTGSVVRPSETGLFITTSQTGSFITTSQTGDFVTTGSTGAFITTGQTGQFYPTSNPSGYVTGLVVRPSETGIFLTSAQTGAFLTTGAADNRYYGLSNGQLISGYAITGFNDSITGITVTGVDTKTISLFRRGNTTLTVNFTDNAGSGSSDTGYLTGYVSKTETGAFLTTGAADGRYALQSATGSFVVTTQTGAFLTTGAADNRYYGIVSTGEIYIDAGAMLTGVSGATSTGIAFVNSGLSSDAYNFDAATNQYSLFKMAIPDNWNKGTIKSKFYWTASGGNGNVVWGIQAAAFSDDDPIDGSWGTAQEVTDSFITGNDLHISAATSAITISNSPASNDLIMFRTYRNAAAAGDTYSLGANLLGVKIQYTISGSITSW